MSKYLILATCAAAVLCTACSNEQDLDSQSGERGKQVNFVIEGPVTRTTTNDNYTTEFIAGDRIGIYATKGASGNNAPHEVGANGTLTADPGEGIYYNGFGDKTADFYAYYPYGEQNTAGQVEFTVNADQSTEALFNASDFMTSESLNNSVEAEGNIALGFQHRLALVQLEVVLAAGVAAPDSVLLNHCLTSVAWKYKDGSLTTGGNAANIKMWGKSSNGLTYWALVPAQTIDSKTPLLTLSADDKTFIFTTSGNINLTANRIKKFKIGIGTDGKMVVFSTDLTVSAWTQDGEEITGDGTLLEPSALLEEVNFSNFTYTDITKNKEQITSGGWYRFLLNPVNDVVEVKDFSDGQGEVMHIRRPDTKSWHNGTFYYCVENVMKGRYALKFKAKSSQAANMKKNQLRIGAYMQESVLVDGKPKYTDYYAIIEKGKDEVTTVYHQVLTYDRYDEYTITFDLGKVSTIHNGTAATVTEESKSVPTAELLKKVVLYIAVNAANVDFYVDDISWKPVK